MASRSLVQALLYVSTGNALTDMSSRSQQGTLQPNGQTVPEATFDVEHVAQSIVHIASLPTNVTVLDYKIMCVDFGHSGGEADLPGSRATEMPFVGRG